MTFRTLTAEEIECRCYSDGTITDCDGNIRRQYVDRAGYARVYLKTKSGMKRFLVHRIIAMCFIPNPNSKPCVNHIDGDKLNNSVENLEWCTYSENEHHSYHVLGKKVSMSHMRKIQQIHADSSSKKVDQISEDGEVVAVFDSQAKASKETGISQGNISECCNGKRKIAGGYKWAFHSEH